MTVRKIYSVSARCDGKATRVQAIERAKDVQLKFNRITDEPELTPGEARELAHSLYLLAARLEKRLVQEQNPANAEASPVPESCDEERQGGEAPTPANERPDRLDLHEAARLAECGSERGAAGRAPAVRETA